MESQVTLQGGKGTLWRGVALPALTEMGRVFIAEIEKRDGRNYLNKHWGTGRCVCGGLAGGGGGAEAGIRMRLSW